VAAIRLLAAAALLVVGASGWSDGRAASRACPSRPAALPNHYGVLRGDVDGDGRSDSVSVKVDRRAPLGCQFFLVARTARGDLIRRVSGRYDFQQEWPQVVVLARIDRRPGAEVVVTLDHGASQAFGSIFTVRGGVLRRYLESHRYARFNFYGSVGFGGAIDCLGKASGRVVWSGYGHQEGERYVVERQFLRLEGTEFRRIRTEHYRRERYGSWERFPEFRSPQLFPSCTIARNRQAG
jgi:hypothetical protein